MSKKKQREHMDRRRVLEVGTLRLNVTGEDGKYYHTEQGSFRKLREDVRIVTELEHEGAESEEVREHE